MNLLFVVPGGVHPSGEVEVIPVLLNLFKALSAEHRVVIIALEQHLQLTEYPLCGAQVISLPKVKLRRLFGAANTVAKRLQYYDFQPDVIHAFWLGKPVLLASLIATKYRTPLFSTIAGGEMVDLPAIEYGGERSLLKRWLNRLSLRLSDGISCGSLYLQQRLKQHNIKAQLVPLGLAPDFWPCCAIAEDKPQQWQLIQVASINQVKNPWLLLDILVRLNNANFNFHFNWVGEDTLSGVIQQKAVELGLDEVIEFHGFKSQNQLKTMLKKQHFIIQTSHYESQGVAMMEACSQGVCPIGTHVGWMHDVGLGVTATTESLASVVAEQILSLSSDVNARQQRLDVAQQWLVKHDLNMTIARFTDCYNKLTGL